MRYRAIISGLSLVLAGVAAPMLARAAEPIAVIVPLADAKRSVTLSDLALIFRRKRLLWPDGGKIVPINLPASDPVRRDFSLAVFSEPIEASEAYWNDMYFHGITPPFVASSDEAVIRFIEQSKDGIGYVPYCSVDRRVAVLLVIDSAGHPIAPAALAPLCSH
jgi:hypothetical protein